MSDVILEKLFGGEATVKVLRLFLFNENLALTQEEIASKVHTNFEWTKNAIDYLEKLGFFKKRSGFRDFPIKNGKKGHKTVKKRMALWLVNPNFPMTDALRQFFHRANIVSPKEVISKLSSTGNLKLITISGMFLEDNEARLDLLVVGDNLKKASFDKGVGAIEALLGREIRYATFETPEFLYRYGMYDRLVRDVFDYKHEKILNKLAVFGEN